MLLAIPTSLQLRFKTNSPIFCQGKGYWRRLQINVGKPNIHLHDTHVSAFTLPCVSSSFHKSYRSEICQFTTELIIAHSYVLIYFHWNLKIKIKLQRIISKSNSSFILLSLWILKYLCKHERVCICTYSVCLQCTHTHEHMHVKSNFCNNFQMKR